jgi:hypothetical protein
MIEICEIRFDHVNSYKAAKGLYPEFFRIEPYPTKYGIR